MNSRALHVLLALAVALSLSAGTVATGSAIEPQIEDSHGIFFPWVPNGSEIEDPRNDFGANGPFFGTVTVQNLENQRIDLYFAPSDGIDYDDFADWEAQKLSAGASVTLSADDIGIESPGGGVVVVGFLESSSAQPARIAAVQKQASDVAPDNDARTSEVHRTVGGYTGIPGDSLGHGGVLPIVQVNNNWNTIIHVTNFDDVETAEVTLQLYPAAGSGWGNVMTAEIEPGETVSVDLMDTNAPAEWVGSVTIASDTSVGAVAERAKNETNMLIMNVSQNAEAHGGVQSAPLIFDDWHSWNTGVSIANLSDSVNKVTITYYDRDGVVAGTDELDIPANGMNFVYSPASLEDEDDDNGESFVGSALITSEAPIVGAVDEVKYLGDDDDTGHAMSYMIELQAAELGQSLSMPLVQKGSPVNSEGDTTGIQLFNPSEDSVTVALWYINQNGSPISAAPDIIALDAKQGHTAYAFDEPDLGIGFQGSAIVQVVAGDGAVAGMSNNVNYSVEYDGSSSYNLTLTDHVGPDVSVVDVAALSLTSDPDGDNAGKTFDLIAQLEDSFGNPWPMEGVNVTFKIDEDGSVNANLHKHGNDSNLDSEVVATTDANGIARASALRDDLMGESWLPWDATVTATLDATSVGDEIELRWIAD